MADTADIYYKKNVRYPVVARQDLEDHKGRLLTEEDPYVSTPTTNLRNFKIANRRAIEEGLIIEAQEPSVEWETTNSLTPEQITELLKQYLKLKQVLNELTSPAMVGHILEMAKEQNKSKKTIDIIQSRYSELTEDEILPGDMKGIE